MAAIPPELLDGLSSADRAQVRAFARFLEEIGTHKGAVKILDHRWIMYIKGGPEPPMFWEGD